MIDPSSYLGVRDGKVCAYVGPDATRLVHAIALRSAIGLYVDHHIIVARGTTITQMLTMAARLTGQHYGRSKALQAVRDLTCWIESMRAALPKRTEGMLDGHQ